MNLWSFSNTAVVSFSSRGLIFGGRSREIGRWRGGFGGLRVYSYHFLGDFVWRV